MDISLFHLFGVYLLLNFIVLLLSWTLLKNIMDEFIQLNCILYVLGKIHIQSLM